MSAPRLILAGYEPGHCGGSPLFPIFRICDLTYF